MIVSRRIPRSVFVLFALVNALFCGFSQHAMATTLTVQADGSGPYTDLQSALTAAASGDTILLGDGVFTGDGNRSLTVTDKDLTFRSISDDPTLCVVECLGASAPDPYNSRFLSCHGSNENRIEIRGLTISSGTAGTAGALLATDVELVVRNCRFSGNRTLGIYGPGGGALVQVRGTLQLDRCLFQDNEAHEMPQFRRRGGAVSCDSATVVISECGFIENFCAGEFDTGGIGGALSADACTLLVQDTVFLRNHVGPSNMGASYGGAVSAAGGTTRFTRCLFAGNIAEGWGGAFALYGNDGSGTATFTSCTFADQGAWSGCLFARSGGQVNLEACIISGTDTWYDETYIEPGNWAADVWEPATITCTACNIWDNGADWTGPLADQLGVDGNFSGDPCYCDPDLDDYGLCADSWCAAENNPARPGVLVGALPVSCAACDCGGELLDSGDLPGAAMSHLVDVVPNPFNPLTHVRFEVAQRQPVRIAVYDVAGQEVAVLTDKTYDPGPHEVTWNGQDHRGRAVAAGIYLVRLTSDTGGDVRKAVLVR